MPASLRNLDSPHPQTTIFALFESKSYPQRRIFFCNSLPADSKPLGYFRIEANLKSIGELEERQTLVVALVDLEGAIHA